MVIQFKELDFQSTAHGDISLRMRSEPRLDNRLIYEVKLGEEFLMSSLFVEGEVALATLALKLLPGKNLDVVVGGLGLGHTAAAVLDHASVKSLRVIEIMPAVIDWHRRDLVPLGRQLCRDPRCELVQGDFFTLCAESEGGFYPAGSDRRSDAILLDIDHSPDHWLTPANQQFYSPQGLNSLREGLAPGGIFGLWSNDAVDDKFVELLAGVFEHTDSHVVTFDNPYTDGKSSNTIYLARRGGAGSTDSASNGKQPR